MVEQQSISTLVAVAFTIPVVLVASAFAGGSPDRPNGMEKKHDFFYGPCHVHSMVVWCHSGPFRLIPMKESLFSRLNQWELPWPAVGADTCRCFQAFLKGPCPPGAIYLMRKRAIDQRRRKNKAKASGGSLPLRGPACRVVESRSGRQLAVATSHLGP